MLDLIPSPNTPRFAFNVADEIYIDGRRYQYFETRGNEHLFFPVDGTGPMEAFNNSQISRWLNAGKFEHRPARVAEPITEVPPKMLSLFSAKEKKRAAYREAFVLAFLEKHRKDEIKRTDAGIRAAMNDLRIRAGEIMREGVPSGMASTSEIPDACGPRSLRRWVKGYERFGIVALYDDVADRGNRDRRLTDHERCLMYAKVASYMTDLKKTPANIVDDVQTAFVAENEKIKVENENIKIENERIEAENKAIVEESLKRKLKVPRLELVCPSKLTIRAAIHQLDPFRVRLTRDGKDAARRAYSPVGEGIDVERPLQRVEMDEQKIDVITLMEDAGLLQMLTEDEKRSLGLDGARKRWWMTVALCVRTRCIVGMTLSRTPTAQSGLRTLEMATRDKGIWAQAAGAEEPWDQGGMIGTLVTDCGKQFVGHEFRARAHDLGINVLHTPAAAPWLKPYIERVFRTFSTRLMPRLSGCTFGDVIRRGTANPKEKAALTVEDLCAVLVRWIVDVYHNMPHEGLDGETPLNCWRRLTERFGVTPPPSPSRRGLVFGLEMGRTLQKDGITVLGVRYHSRKLAEHMVHSRNREMEVRWYPEDIGAIWVKIGSEWSQIHSVYKRFQGVSALQWLVASRELRGRYAREAQLKMSTVGRALDFIEATNGEAMRRVGLVLQDWSPERIEREERQLYVGFRIAEDEEEAPADDGNGGWGSMLPTADCDLQAGPDVEKFENHLQNASADFEPIQPSECQPPASSDDDEDDDELLPLRNK